MDTSYHTSLGAHQAAQTSPQTTLLTSNGTSVHKATVVIEPPVVKKTPSVVVAEPVVVDDDYVVRLQPAATSSPVSVDPSSNESVADVSVDTPTASAEITPPVVWTGGCSNSPAPVPTLINFELTPTSQEQATPVASILPFSAHKFDLDEKKSEVSEIAQIETPTPKPDTTEPVTISGSANNDKMTYSTTFTQAESRSTGMSPPNESYGFSPSTSPLSYSQAAHGASFAGPSIAAVSFGDSYAGPATYAGPSCSSSVPSYAGPVSAPVTYASSE